jgi:hypothetical protein
MFKEINDIFSSYLDNPKFSKVTQPSSTITVILSSNRAVDFKPIKISLVISASVPHPRFSLNFSTKNFNATTLLPLFPLPVSFFFFFFF